jgi:predicted permease
VVLREARRFLKTSPILSLSGILVLALGIGASTFALAILLAFSSLTPPGIRNMGYATVSEETEGGGSVSIAWNSFDYISRSPEPNIRLAAYTKPITTTLEVDSKSNPLAVAAISNGFFSIFTSDLTAGRDFNADEQDQVGQHVVIVGVPLATRLFKSPQAALNRLLMIRGTPYRIVGVAPFNFSGLFGTSVDAWVPASSIIPLQLQLPPSMAKLVKPDIWKNLASFYVLAASSNKSSASLAASLGRSLPLRQTGKSTLHVSQGLTTDPVRDANLRKWFRLGLLLAAIFTIISSLNFSLLLLARTPRRADEVVLKRALGANSGRLVAELMIGPAAIMATAVILASVLWIGGLKWVSGISPFYEQLVRGSWHDALLAFGVQLPVVCALTLFIALIPAIQLLRGSASPHMGYAATTTRRTGFFLQLLVTSQVTLCIATWILAGMVVGAVMSALNQGFGYEPAELSVVSVAPGSGIINFQFGKDTFPPHAVIEALLNQLDELPGVRGVAFADTAPFGSPMNTLTIQRANSSATPRTANVTYVSPQYFQTVGAAILRGTAFSWDDVGGPFSGAPGRIVVNRILSRELWPDTDPVGQTVKLTIPSNAGMPSPTTQATVAGVVGDMRSSLGGSTEPTLYQLLDGAYPSFYLIVKGRESALSLRQAVSKQLAALIPDLAVSEVYSVADRAQASRWQIEKRAYFALAGALLMALIAYIGLYGALAFYVNTRRRELAVRVCLGALPPQIRKIVLARAARCAALAAIISVPLWPVLAQLSSSDYLGSVSWSTPRAILLSLACIAVAIFVSLIPARSAVRTSPAEVLKEL